MKRKFNTPVITGILGADSGCGATHMAVAMANVAANRLHRRTALIGMHSDALCQMLGENYEYREGLYHFNCLDFEVFAPAGELDLSAILSMGYEEIFIDFGSSEIVSHEFTICNRRFITGSLAPYRWRNMVRFLEANTKSLSGMRACVICFGNKRMLHRMKKAFSVTFINPPFITDPLYLSLKIANELAGLLSSN